MVKFTDSDILLEQELGICLRENTDESDREKLEDAYDNFVDGISETDCEEHANELRSAASKIYQIALNKRDENLVKKEFDSTLGPLSRHVKANRDIYTGYYRDFKDAAINYCNK